MHYACTLVLARLTYRLFSYGLPFVAKEAGVDLVDHHDALADANAAAQVMIDMASRHKAESIEALLEDLGVLLGELTPEMWAGCRKFFNTGKRTAPVANLDADPDHPLYGQFVSFTGTLQTMRRQEAQERVASVGGTPELSVTRRTTILVEGYKIPQR
jgi:DNA polymerase-3 subunit epsilon